MFFPVLTIRHHCSSLTIILVHSFILLAQAITLSTCIVAHNNTLVAMLISNNFAEIKSNVFKRYSKDNVQSLVYFGKKLSSILFAIFDGKIFILTFISYTCILCISYLVPQMLSDKFMIL